MPIKPRSDLPPQHRLPAIRFSLPHLVSCVELHFRGRGVYAPIRITISKHFHEWLHSRDSYSKSLQIFLEASFSQLKRLDSKSVTEVNEGLETGISKWLEKYATAPPDVRSEYLDLSRRYTAMLILVEDLHQRAASGFYVASLENDESRLHLAGQYLRNFLDSVQVNVALLEISLAEYLKMLPESYINRGDLTEDAKSFFDRIYGERMKSDPIDPRGLQKLDYSLYVGLRNWARRRGIPFSNIVPGEIRTGAPRRELGVDPATLDPANPTDAALLALMKRRENERERSARAAAKKRSLKQGPTQG